ncbi:MAG: hypothetical protein KGD64_13810 [Candidatus Heimdallarchaeota archaeon]|nr:hypothetical protein [Candidatus Heimdallarchaeota archaeon]
MKILEFIFTACAAFLEMFFLIIVGVLTVINNLVKNQANKINNPNIKTISKKGWIIGPQ